LPVNYTGTYKIDVYKVKDGYNLGSSLNLNCNCLINATNLTWLTFNGTEN